MFAIKKKEKKETYSDKTIENVWSAEWGATSFPGSSPGRVGEDPGNEVEWGGDIFYSHGSKHSRGVMILIRPALKVENTSISGDNNGRVLIVNLTIQDEEFCLANIYAPNDQSVQVDFYTQLKSKLRLHVNAKETLIVLSKILIK